MGKNNKYKDLSGKTFGLLKVLHRVENRYNKQARYLCECQCNNKTLVEVNSIDLRTGYKDNCGCLTKIKQRNAKKKYNTYDLSGEYGIGYTHKGEEFYFDLEDYEKIKNYCWYKHGKYIESRSLDGSNTIIKMHRLVMNAKEGDEVDHIFHREYDNRKSELRLVTNQENSFNSGLMKNNTSGVTGVNWDTEKQMWRARIWVNYQCIHLGYYNSFEDAIKIRKEAEIKYFREYRYMEEIQFNE